MSDSIFEGLHGKDLLAVIKENIAALKHCPCHVFPELDSATHIHDRVHCKQCGGEMTVRDAKLWTDGYEAGLHCGLRTVV